jgi:hypothetical protein
VRLAHGPDALADKAGFGQAYIGVFLLGVAAATLLAFSAEVIAQETGLGDSFAGFIFAASRQPSPNSAPQ